MNKVISHFLLYLMIFDTAPVLSFTSHASAVESDLVVVAAQPELVNEFSPAEVPAADNENASHSIATGKHLAKLPVPAAVREIAMVPPMPAAGGGGSNVETFTGDFSYSIPLMDVEGFPITLSYNSNVTMHQEASWVGLGWNLDLGKITRELRGVPDDFNGQNTDKIDRHYNLKVDNTTGNKYGGYVGIAKKEDALRPRFQLTALWGSYTNSYLGRGKTFDFGLQSAMSIVDSKDKNSIAPSFNLGYSHDSKQGNGINQSIGVSGNKGPGDGGHGVSGGVGTTYGLNRTSRGGLQQATISTSLNGGYSDNRGPQQVSGSFSATGNIGSTSVITFGTRTSMPRASFNSSATSNNFALNVYFRYGTGTWAELVGGIYEHYSSETKTVTNSNGQVSQPALGYLHSGKRLLLTQSDDATFPVMDFERGNDFDYSEKMKNLPFSIQTYDVFYVNSPVFGGTFRAGRTDYGTYYDATTQSEMNRGSELVVDDDITMVNVGVATPPITIELGYSSGIQQAKDEFSVWGKSLEFEPVASGNVNVFDATTYFKSVGEVTRNSSAAFEYLGGNYPDKFDISASQSDKKINPSTLLAISGQSVSPSSLNAMDSKPVRATSFQPLTNEYLTGTDVSNWYKHYYHKNASGAEVSDDRTTLPQNHIGAIQVTSVDGIQMMYDIPVYTVSTSQVTFSVTGRPINLDNTVNYSPGNDNSISNQLGRSNYYDKTTVPKFASEFLLTRITSPDYVDLGDDGPTADDIGSYHKINYTKAQNAINRFPYSPNSSATNAVADIERGYLASDLDDLGHYSYNESEIWYPFSVEGKTMVAEFILDTRHDALPALDENGGKNSANPKKLLHMIKLYSLDDRLNNANAIPLQIVEFVYDYSLCPNTPMNDGTVFGKLTLKGLKFYSGAEKINSLSTYEFSYLGSNPAYDYQAADGWGNYKANNLARPNYLYQMAEQNGATADDNASAWKLTNIVQPGGGKMQIAYEADRYKRVQNKSAMSHMTTAGMMPLYKLKDILTNSSWTTSDLTSDFVGHVPQSQAPVYAPLVYYYGAFEPDYVPNNVFIFKLKTPLSAANYNFSSATQKVKDTYFKDQVSGLPLTDIYFKLYTKIHEDDSDYEMIPVFGKVMPDNVVALTGMTSSSGVLPVLSGQSQYEYGFVVLEMHNSSLTLTTAMEAVGQGVARHPFQQYAIDYARQNLPDLVYGSCDGCHPNTSLDNASFFRLEFYDKFIKKGYLPSIIADNSTIKLYVDEKYGGGARVKSITVSDNWQEISSENLNFSTSVEYDYSQGYGGVSAAEPRGLDDESPLYEWSTYLNIIRAFPDQTKFHVKPMSAQLMPNAVVGYQKVISKTLSGTKGWGESTYWTASDKPFSTHETVIDKSAEVKKRNILTGKSIDLLGLTQGYLVQTNDFHGKLRSSATYDPAGNAISATNVEYYELGEKLPVINRNKQVSYETVATEFDAHLDSRMVEATSKYQLVGLTITWTPAFIFKFFPNLSFNSKETGFYSSTFIKHVNRSAVVKSVETVYLGSSNTAENLLYDYYSGTPVLTSLNDEFNDKLYSFNYPSHWAYPELREIQRSAPQAVSGTLTVSNFLPANFSQFFADYATGDQVTVTSGGTTTQGYIYDIDPLTNSVILINNNGGPIVAGSNQSGTITFVKQNRLNRLSETMESAVTKYAITVAATNDFPFPVTEIYGASAIDYRQKGSVKCPAQDYLGDNIYNNPFLYGGRGKLYPNTTYSWQSERSSANQHGARFNGYYASFTPFYTLNNGVWRRPVSLGNWREGQKAMEYDIMGNLVEIKDPIGVSAATLYGYNPKLQLIPVASADNAKTEDIAFDCFEDYSYAPTFTSGTEHFSFSSNLLGGSQVTSSVRHSGNSSLSIPQGQYVSKSVSLTSCSLDADNNPSHYSYRQYNCLCTAPFNPNQGTYLVSVWIKQTGSGATASITANGTLVTATAVTPVIDGWQKFESQFVVSGNTLTIKLDNSSGSGIAYYDDFRIHPLLSNMSTTVYDSKTLIPVASQDSENFTTFYNYDENYIPVRVRVETIEGIKTISESQSNIHRSN